MKTAGILVAVALAAIATTAHAGCDTLPAPVTAYVRAHPGWAVVRVADLVSDDQALWAQYHKGLCPGWAKAKLDAARRPFYAVALISRTQEKLMLIDGAGGVSELVPANRLTTPMVVWTVLPGVYRDENTGRDVHISTQSITYEKMEAVATQFYLKHGKIRSLLAAQ